MSTKKFGIYDNLSSMCNTAPIW